MPAQEEYLRNIKLMHVVFCISCVALVAASVWAVFADYDDEWRDIQRIAFKADAQQNQDEQRALKTQTYEAEKAASEKAVRDATESLAQHAAEIAKLEARISSLKGDLDRQTRDTKFQGAVRDAARANLGLMVRDNITGDRYDDAKKKFDAEQQKYEALDLRVQELTAEFANLNSELATLTEARTKAEAELKALTATEDRLIKSLNQVAPQDPLAAAKWSFMEWPIIEGFNGHLKPNQLWLPKLKINYGGMGEVARFDRCITCHVNIDKVKPGNTPAYPFDPHGLSVENAAERFHKDDEALRAALAAGKPYQPERTYAHPFATHPRPDLYLTAASPHPMQQFGCTGCHEGQGSGTSFHNVQHMPNTPAIGERWSEKYGWFYNHFWEYPMLPDRLSEAGCIKCHHDVVELGVHPKFGASAPKAYEGFTLLTEYGCFGCHEVNGYNAGKPIGPDIRLEPQTDDERDRIAADPTAVAGEYRKVGPGLRHLSHKTTEAFVEHWVNNPQEFHPKTKMPRFFHLTNLQDDVAERYQPVEIAGIARYLEKSSQDLAVDDWGDYQPNAIRGKQLFSQRGCLACHEHTEFEGSKADFGPDLSHVDEKIKRDGTATDVVVADGENSTTKKIALSKWLYTWVREPSRHSPRTKMPNLYLEPEGEGDKRIDPAADIVAWLLSKSDKPSDRFQKIDVQAEPFQKTLNEMTQLYLRKTLSVAQVKETMKTGVYPRDPADIKGDEIELAIQLEEGLSEAERNQKIQDARLMYIGRRTISRYGCYGCHDIPGFERARPIGTALQDWGRKDPAKLALEHIEEYLHHHGEPDGSSTAARLEEATRLDLGSAEVTEQQEADQRSAYFYGQLLSHGRAGFLWQKLRDPRSYDYKVTETKGYDERLRMPKFPFDERQIESIANFVLGLTAEPPGEPYVYRPQGAAKARIEGEKLISQFNCASCHMLEMPRVDRHVAPADFAIDTSTPEACEALDELLKSGSMAALVRGGQGIAFKSLTAANLDAVLAQLDAAPANGIPQRIANDDLIGLAARLAAELGYDADKVQEAQESVDGLKEQVEKAPTDNDLKVLLADAEAKLAQTSAPFAKVSELYRRLTFAELDPVTDSPGALDLLMQIRSPRADQLRGEERQAVSFHGMRMADFDPEADPEDQAAYFVNWETHELGQKVILPQANIEVSIKDFIGYTPGRGGDFAMWLVDSMRGSDTSRDVLTKALQSVPPPLYQQGRKVQTSWLYRFLKNPDRIRHMTVLRMPQFTLSDAEAQQLANYFAAVDEVEFPYQDVPQRQPEYLHTLSLETEGRRDEAYLAESFKAIDLKVCNGCHAVAGKPYAGNPLDPKNVRGPDLNERVPDRFRPDWLKLWLYKPAWVLPYTSMPVNYPPAALGDDGKPQPKDADLAKIFHGYPDLQVTGARDALMNYHRLMMRERAATPVAPPAEGAPAEEKPAANSN